jgi:hypothetical protein
MTDPGTGQAPFLGPGDIPRTPRQGFATGLGKGCGWVRGHFSTAPFLFSLINYLCAAKWVPKTWDSGPLRQGERAFPKKGLADGHKITF